MKQHYECPTHGHELRHALDDKGNIVLLHQALHVRDVEERRVDYFCPNSDCGIQVFPERSTIVRATNSARIGHFNRTPESTIKYDGPQRESLAELVKDVIAETLRFSRDFDYVGTNLGYASERSIDGTFWPHRTFDVDIHARKEGDDGLDVILHVLEFPRKESANELYRRIKEISTEDSPGAKRKYVTTPDGSRIQLNKRVYQNFIVIKNEDSYWETDRNTVIFRPTIYEFLRYLAGEVCFFDPTAFTLDVVSMDDPKVIEDSHKKDSSREFRVEHNVMPYFSFFGEDKNRIERELSNRDEGKSISMAHWKLAVPTPVLVDENGNPLSVTRKSGQGAMLL